MTASIDEIDSSPSLADVILLAARASLADFWSALPGRVIDFDHTTGTATIQPFPATKIGDTVSALPILRGVPVAFPGGGALIDWPIAAGSRGIVVFASLPLARWRETGSEGDPIDRRRGSLADAWYLPIAERVTTDPANLSIRPPGLGKVVIAPGVTLPAARAGDPVAISLSEADIIAITAAQATIAGGGHPPSIPLSGTITAGSLKVEIG
jgi:hypothetical protein